MVDRHSHEERHFGLVPTDQLGASDGTAGWILSDDGTGFGEFIPAPTGSGGMGLGLILEADAACQTVSNWTGEDGGTVTVETPATGGSFGPADGTQGADAIQLAGDVNATALLSGADSFLEGVTAGHRYAVLVAIQAPDLPSGTVAWTCKIDTGTDDSSAVFSVATDGVEVGRWHYLVLYLDATGDADPATVAFSVQHTSGAEDINLYIGFVQVIEVVQFGTLRAIRGGTSASDPDIATQDGYDLVDGDSTTVGGDGLVHKGSLRVGKLSGWLQSWRSGFNYQDSGGEGNTYLFAEHAAGDVAEKGHLIEVGEDYVGVYISEKDAGTLQMYPTGNDIELAANGGGTWIIDGGGA